MRADGVDLAVGQPGVQWVNPGTGPSRREHTKGHREAVLAQNRHPVAGPDALRDQEPRQPVYRRGAPSVGPRLTAVALDQAWPFGAQLGPPDERLPDGVVGLKVGNAFPERTGGDVSLSRYQPAASAMRFSMFLAITSCWICEVPS